MVRDRRHCCTCNDIRAAPAGRRSGQGPPRPPEKEPERRQEPAQPDEPEADLDDLALRDQGGRQAGEDLLELLRALGREVHAAGDVRDGPERVLVDAAREAAAAEATAAEAAEPAVAGLVADELAPADRIEIAALRRAVPDRVDAEAAIRGLVGRVDRIRPGVARPVGEQDDDVRRVGARRDRRRRDARLARLDALATFGSTSETASIAARIPLPTAVRRPVVSDRIADTSAFWSVVGGWITAANPLNATIPIWVSAFWFVTKAIAASSAASIRVGSMSVEHMLPDTSIARITVVWFVGTLRTTEGRARASTRTPTAEASRANGRCRRNRARPGAASRTRARLE